ncbi:MAG: cation transporter [Chloroflexi bacterium]|nr:MAG: cation transporter [Chloroflexota bacterium]
MAGDHGHSHVDTSVLTSERGIQALKVSIVGLLLTALFQAGIAIVGGSAGLLADTLHNFADMFTALPLWIAFALQRRAANRRYTYGYNRAEDVAGAIIVLVILASAGIAAYESYVKLVSESVPRLLGWGMVAGLVGFVGNELVAEYRIKVGKEIGSAALVADGQHARVDGLTSLAAFFGLLGVRLGFPVADPIAGFVITIGILFIVFDVGGDIMGRLMDAIEPETIGRIERCAASVEGVAGVHDVRARWIGHKLACELHIAVDGEISVVEGHDIAEEVRHALLHEFERLNDVIVHVDPWREDHPLPASPPAPHAHDVHDE